MHTWPAQDAKARFSELLDACMTEGPQMVTKRGCEAALLVTVQEWRRLQSASRPSLKALLLTDQARAEWVLPARGHAKRRPPQALGLAEYLLGTNVVSELRKPRPHGGVLAWLQAVDDSQLLISAVTLGEMQAGIEMTREQDMAKAAEIEAWLELVGSAFNVLPVDGKAFRHWARLMHRQADTLHEDALIAVTAQVHSLTVVTRNVADFRALGLQVLNPFEPR